MLRFTTNAYPKEQRWDSWRFALQRKSILLEAMNADTAYGELASYQSQQKLEFICVSSTPQILKIDMTERADQVWLLSLLEGDLRLTDGGQVTVVAEGGLIFGDGNAVAGLDLHRDHRFLLVTIPKSFLSLRVRNPLPGGINPIASDIGAGRILSGMLRSVADTINELNTDRIRPVELSLPEFLLTALMEDAPSKSLGGAAGARAMLLERVFQTIEMHLSDPNLNLQQVAAEHGISMRYLQKLFESVNESFGHYVKLRRLERCRMDLLSPLHAQKSISDILFQWGFNDSASFSRAFREQYGISPREYRKSPPAHDSAEAPRRGRPQESKESRFREDLALSDEGEDALEDGVEAVEVAEVYPQRSVRHHLLPATPETIHWGYLSRHLKPALRVQSGDYVTIETLTHHAGDDYERMIEGDAGAEAVYHWTADEKTVDRRGAGPMDASAVGRGAGEGFGVHICTGPIAIAGAKPGDIVEVRFLEIKTRPSHNPKFAGRSFGSNVAAYWGFHYNDLLEDPKPREVVTIYEVETGHERCCAHAVYNFRYTPQTDPFGTRHDRYDYPGVVIDPDTIERNFDVLRNVEVPVRPHFGFVALAPAHDGLIDSVPPANFGGNIDNWRLGPGASIYLPVNVAEGLLSLGDPHASQGDSELCGTAIECSMTTLVQIVLHPKSAQRDPLRDLDYPLIETKDEWIVMGFSQPNYLRELGDKAQSDIYKKASVEGALRDAFRKARRFLMTTRGLTEDEAVSLLSVGVDFGVSQMVNGNWGAHAIIRKALFTH
ncbi:acetamidase/formamidase family protein [Asticcacaulis excentricus]|uniref:Transcriptional regulator, AraC family with acetamidase/formamidase activity n=1 Tax=Asticcacaulis excentricus (strain ATCC 15261 / DSM 4724 / KCTC 12464 / NCIMB 9791 / VKM B-1370 / CB 48) TaxID=573065 RepID=E8RUS7_ASTEC|nr:acetamidase/formamidase family protein [Asticcacaulis excentricus]ADU14127.1 transcriptional regulator, AraC family with acetamidase/formamidase activity [Asticcacaulis excentricus CB 48]